MPPDLQPPAHFHHYLERVADFIKAQGVFGAVSLTADRLEASAKASASPAAFRLDLDRGKPWVSLVTADRWLSQSIEADLVHTGDKLDELLAEELTDLNYSGPALPFEHYRSEDKLFTFRSPVPLTPEAMHPGDPRAVETAAVCLLAYEACFRPLGDMEADEDK